MAFAQAEPPATDTRPIVEPAISPEARLEQAIRYYQMGDRDEARRILAALVVTPNLSAELRQESRVYLAELLMVENDSARAREFLEQVLREDPTYTIDPFRHTPEVAGEFDYVKALLAPVQPPDEPPPPVETVLVTMPLSVWSPFGRYHFSQGRPIRGLIYFTGFTTTAVGSGFLFGLTHADRRYPVGATVGTDEADAVFAMRRTQWVLTGLCYGIWATSIIDARVHWRKVDMKASLQPEVGFRQADGGLQGSLALRASF